MPNSPTSRPAIRQRSGWSAAALLILLTGVTSRGGAQEADTVPQRSRPVPLAPVVSIGTRVPERTASASAVPVDAIPSEQLAGTGVPETWQQLQRLVPSVHVPHIPLGDNHMRPVTLRGQSPHHVLVLVNGKRRHPAAALLAGPTVPFNAMTDIGTIPPSAIERIEVLRDGAAAQYGSDAIGGVINIVLRTGERRELRTTAGSVYSSEGGREFRDGQYAGAGGAWGVSTPGGSRLTVSGEIRDRRGTNRAYPDQRPQYFPGDPRNDAPPRISAHFGNGILREVLGFVSAAVPVAAGAEAYLFGGAAGREGRSPDAFFRRPMDPVTVRSIHPDGYLPEIGSTIGDVSATTGVRGTAAGWRWDVSSVWGRNRVGYTVRNSNNPSLGDASPTEFDAGWIAARQWTGNADAARALRMLSMPVNVAVGIEHRVDRYRIGAGEPDSWRDGEIRILDGPARGQRAAVGAQGLPGYRPADELSARRSSSGVYMEVDAKPVGRLLLQAAGRAERYSDFGSTSDGKVAARVEVTSDIALRGSLSTGFRAPALTQQYFSSTRTTFRQIDGVAQARIVRTFPVHTPEAQAMGATPLRPERSVNRSGGIVFDRPRWPLLTFDLYQLELNDRIVLGGSITDTSVARILEENGLFGIDGGNYFTNRVDTRTRGADLVASHAMALGGSGVVRVLAGYNNNRTIVTRVLPTPAPLERFEEDLFNRTSRGVLENGHPRSTVTLTTSYARGRLEAMLHNQRSGPTAQLDRRNPESDQTVHPRWITDVRVGWKLLPRLQVDATVANLFDAYPDEWWDFREGMQVQGPSFQGRFRHPGGLSPFGMNGRTVYVQVAYR
jgi:iron complex outermembrane recepter protein